MTKATEMPPYVARQMSAIKRSSGRAGSCPHLFALICSKLSDSASETSSEARPVFSKLHPAVRNGMTKYWLEQSGLCRVIFDDNYLCNELNLSLASQAKPSQTLYGNRQSAAGTAQPKSFALADICSSATLR